MSLAEAQAKRDAALHALYAAEAAHKDRRGASTDEERQRLGDVRAAYWVAERELSKARERLGAVSELKAK